MAGIRVTFISSSFLLAQCMTHHRSLFDVTPLIGQLYQKGSKRFPKLGQNPSGLYLWSPMYEKCFSLQHRTEVSIPTKNILVGGSIRYLLCFLSQPFCLFTYFYSTQQKPATQLQAPVSLALCISPSAASSLLALACEPLMATWSATLKHEPREKGEGCQHCLIRIPSPIPQVDHSEAHPAQLHRGFQQA